MGSEMTRSFDAIPEEADRTAEHSKSSAPVMSVCPFCGAICEKNDSPCPRCKMENSALTRQATRARIGPWYVMQARNPSAPGMKCNTLLALIRKGQITPRSVVRGPTTFQLWRFAARVKGISREFGLCYSCGAELQRTSTFCPRCSRSQELPPNPDVLLENEPQAAKTVYRQVNPRPEAPGSVPMETPPPPPARPAPVAEAEPDRQSRPATQIPSAAETMAELAEIPSPHNAPAEMQSRARQRPQEGILTPRELAAAFSIQYDPTMDGSRQPPRGGTAKNLMFAALLLLVIGGGVSVFYFVPSLRERFVAWVQDSSPAPATSAQTSNQQKSVPEATPAWMSYVPDETPPITTPAKPSSSGTSSVTGASNSTSGNSSFGNSSSGKSSSGKSSLGPPTSDDKLPAPNHSPASAENSPPPAPPASPPVAVSQNTPPLVIDSPVTTSTPVDADGSAAETVTKLRESSGGDLDSLAMKLRNSGLDAEARQDYTTALYFYQQVESLPNDHWPSDIDRLLKTVQKRIVAGNFH